MTFGIQLSGSGSAKDADGEQAVVNAVNKALYQLSKELPDVQISGTFSGTHVSGAVLNASAGSETPKGKNGDDVKPNLTAEEAGLKEPVGVGTSTASRPSMVSKPGKTSELDADTPDRDV